MLTPQPVTPEACKPVLEAALLAANAPLAMAQLRQMFDPDPGTDVLRAALSSLEQDWQGRGVELARTASGWRFRTRPSMQPWLERLKDEKPPRYSRAVMETLAIIVWRQPVTRGDIEDIRGVSISSGILKTLESRGWIDVVGHRETPGRPALFATTRRFLDDMGLKSLTDLPDLPELERMIDLAGNEETPPHPDGDTTEKSA